MRTIWKYSLPSAMEPGEGFRLDMPEGATIRHFVGAQYGQPTIWAEVDTDAPATPRSFVVVGTGKPLEQVGAYIGTLFRGLFVLHVYEAITAEWTEWTGGDGPPADAAGKVVDVRFRNHPDRIGTFPSAGLDWSDTGQGDTIISYRISAEQPEG